jgi:hypothetical protein
VPKSKTRPRAVARPTASRVHPTPPPSLAAALHVLYEASTELVREAELHIQRDVRAGEDPARSIEVHHYLRTGSLGLLIGLSKLTDMPDPREYLTSTPTT